MGVSGLWQILNPIQEHVPIRNLGGQTLAIDLSGWVCGDIMVNQRVQTVNKLFIRNMVFRIIALLRESILPVAVTDGTAPALKAATLKNRQLAKHNITVGGTNKPISLKRSYFARISAQCCRLLDALGVPCVSSPGEAEAMCAFLNAEKLVDGCVTNDGDAFLYGASMVYRHFTLKSRDASVVAYAAQRVQSDLGLSREALVLLGLLLGCDLWPTGVPKVGPVSAGKLLTDVSFSEVLDHLTGDYSHLVTDQRSSFWSGALWKRIKAGLAECPVLEIVDEFLKPWRDRGDGWTLPSSSCLTWSRPAISRAVALCVESLDWQPCYALAHLAPLLALWIIRKRASREIDDESRQHLSEMIPLRILRKRSVSHLPCFEVEWSRLECDIWSDSIASCAPSDHPLGTAAAAALKCFFTESGYRFCVPASEFRAAFPQLAVAFETIALSTLTDRLETLAMTTSPIKRKTKLKRRTKTTTVTTLGPMDFFVKSSLSDLGTGRYVRQETGLRPWNSSTECSPASTCRELVLRPQTDEIFTPPPKPRLCPQTPPTLNFISVRVNTQFERRLTLESSLLSLTDTAGSPRHPPSPGQLEFSAFKTPIRLLERLQ